MSGRLGDEALDIIFREARTHNAWKDEPVSDETLKELYELMKWGPTSANMSPARIIFVKSKEGKEKLAPALSEGNLKKTMEAPVTAIIGYDVKFYERLPELFPHAPEAKTWFNWSDEWAEMNAFRNGSLQGAYFMIAARSLGLDCGPMSGFDMKKVDEIFFSGTSVKSNFLCNLGHGDPAGLFPRSPRLPFDDACSIV
ncbi:malonic semialdehyde reductase [Parvibaculum sp.]|jgi:3-hydroxypropanoate dehydrogenase|uniref:malonic semialdehyde reductase n=1 Tax=Parvibaculum sp. TaxID=2024848 RepID=UPI000C6BB1E2|nr:malonic semialdehyde reductase [Parvibaculum sp.]HAC59885.1 malonic semialdehyde reductase [Rhodobiaceae bacterium]MAU61390.1 malonic semialdehyde reductase [Parvibaculum sp.]MBO6668336.1 malonic semialdehyde reductase [Parvibaculum sp.]MBO6693110.1 malonic semialdehyde reductase [Parvibaculum sp.]MBO6714546.1 malonic semialdehyde reductase [Parvibaculum sp.]|tara:strand:- start:4139 stop:4732 length:594 start_codon:yes stop_codon:yes gene_type:complete